MLHEIIFSCAGTTRKIADQIAKVIDAEISLHDLTVRNLKGLSIDNPEDVVVIAVPVWGGRVPALAAERLKTIHGHGQRTVAVVVYGNRDYDDALLELCDLANEQGFKIVSAAAFVAEHCIFPTVATGRPDMTDDAIISHFAEELKSIATPLDLSKVKGKRPYKKAMGVPLHPKTDNDACGKCMTCVANCPTDAINPDTLATDSAKCISCCRCISVCSNDARKFDGLMYKTIRFGFEKMCGKRRDPEIFV